jgi:hypothetical protein
MIDFSFRRCLPGGVALAFSLLLPFFCSTALAVESICPGGASPRSDVIACMDFEVPCSNPASDTCWTDNGYTAREDHRGTDMQILCNDPTRPNTGNCYALLKGTGGGTGGGYATYVPASPLMEFRTRYIATFYQYPNHYFNHFLGVSVGADAEGEFTACSRGSTLEVGGPSSVYNYGSGNCGSGSFDLDLHPNQGPTHVPVIKNGKAYMFEVAIKIDTSCTSNTKHGCNGVYKLWIDGDLVISETDLNWGGVYNNAKIRSTDNPRWYRHLRNPMEFPGEIHFDSQVISNDADIAIGAPVGVKNLGTAVADAYELGCGIEGFFVDAGVSYSPELDFAAAGGNRITTCGNFAETWRGNAGTASAEQYHTGVVIDRAIGGGRPYPEQSLKIVCSGANCGGGFRMPRMGGPATGSEGDGSTNAFRLYVAPQRVNFGYIFIKADSVPNDIISYPGFYGEGTTKHSNYVAFGEDDGKWVIVQRHSDGTPTVVETSDVDVVRGVWHKFEIVAWNDNTVSLMIDDKRLFTREALPNSIGYLFDSGHTSDGSGSVFSITDSLGSAPVTIYLDDIAQGSVSFWSCDGWDANMCPFKIVNYPGGGFAWFQ